ncbi:MAG: hypothetical protein PHP62_05450, partial [Candidatus Moranbacteria bacterium]|nr:hypothetical protein [Candidatus Moranbacteria bacterium]
GNLASNANYYFKVRGGNGCMPGVWSNNLSIKEKYMKSAKPAPVKKAVKKATTRTTSPIKQ